MSQPGEDAEVQRPFTHWEAAKMDATGAWAEKRRLAEAMRVVIERLTTSDAPEDELRRAADGLERYAERLASHPQATRYVGFAESANAGDVAGFFDQSPIIGLANPIAPPVSMHAEEGCVVGSAIFGSAYEGPPGCVHGGWVAAAMDELLGFAQSMGGQPGMTGTLTVRYRSPTPLHTELRLQARVDGVERRKTLASGEIYAGDTLCAEAEGIFVSVGRERFERLVVEREERRGHD
jgi:acyl-coenzyme A thioesterase PaaI-like protein